MDLFPVPSPSPAKLSPNPWPGVTPESTQALRELLKDNHERWHVFFDPRGYHNHTAHYLSALWALGADAEVIREAYKLDTPHQVPIKEYPEPITDANFKEHLGDDKFFGGYIKYYEEYIKDKDISDILEKQIFALDANFDASKPANKQPAMLDRFLDAIIHPMIHVGHGLELGLPGLLVEGLASTATHQATGSKLLPKSLWKEETSTTVDTLTSLLPSVLRFGSSAPPKSTKKNVHAFDVLSRILKDPAFDNIEEPYYLDVWTEAMIKYSDAIEKHAREWSYDSTDPNELNKKIEELVYANALLYGVSGWSENEQFNADFLYMHLITSSIFLPSIAVYLKPQSQELLLRSYFVLCIGWWVAHGRQALDIEGFFAKTNAYPVPADAKPVHEHALPNPSSFKASTPNPWLHIIQGAIAHPDDHIPKLQRGLAHWGSVYGSRPAGEEDFKSTELKGAEKIDGTIFIRTAALTHERALSFKEGYTNTGAGTWDRKGFRETRG